MWHALGVEPTENFWRPEGENPRGNCVELNSGKHWNNIFCATRIHYVCMKKRGELNILYWANY